MLACLFRLPVKAWQAGTEELWFFTMLKKKNQKWKFFTRQREAIGMLMVSEPESLQCFNKGSEVIVESISLSILCFSSSVCPPLSLSLSLSLSFSLTLYA